METETKEDKITAQARKSKSKTILISILSTFLLGAGLATGILLVKQNQQIKEKAAQPEGTVKVFLSPDTKTVEIDQNFSVNILLDTGGRYISALTIDLSYPYTGNTPPIEATDLQINSNLVVNGDWNFPIKTINTDNQLVQIRIGGLNSSIQGFKTTGEEVIATINFQAREAGSIKISFNPTTTKATDKSTGDDILLTPSIYGSYTVSAPVSTETKSQPTMTTMAVTTTPISTLTTSPTITPTATTKTTSRAISNTETPIPALTPTTSPVPMPESGIPYPTILGLSGGILLIILALSLTL